MQQEQTCLPRYFWIGVNIMACLFLVLIGGGIGFGIGFHVGRDPGNVAVVDDKKTPPDDQAVMKNKPSLTIENKLDRKTLIGKWERSSSSPDLELPAVWDFKEDGSYWSGAVYSTGYKCPMFPAIYSFQWRLDGDILTQDQGGNRYLSRVKLEKDGQVVLTPKGNEDTGRFAVVLKRFTKEREKFCREKHEKK